MKLIVLRENNTGNPFEIIAPAKYFKTRSAQNTYDGYGQKLGREYGLCNTVKAYNYHDGHNWQTVTIDASHGEPTHIRIGKEEEKMILRHYRVAKAKGWKDAGPGLRKCSTSKFEFTESYWQGSWELATVESI